MNNKLGMARVVVLRLKMERVASIVALGVFLAMAQPQAMAQRFFYRFITIADTEQGFPFSDSGALGFGYPCQNENGVAFEGNLANAVNTDGMFFSTGYGSYKDIADTNSQQYTSFGTDCSINANGLVLFYGYQGTPGLLLLGGVGTQTQTLLSPGGTYDEPTRFQLNGQGKAVLLAARSDGSGEVVLTKVAGGSENVVATTFPGSPYTSFGAVSINSAGTVAFSANRPDGSEGIFTVSENGITQVLADSGSGPVADFEDIDLNDKGSVAFDGVAQDGTPSVWRVDNAGGGNPPVVTKITDANIVGAYYFTGVSINSSGQVAYAFLDGDMYPNIGFGDGGLSALSPLVVQPYSFILGRLVASGFMTQDSLNDLGQIAVLIVFSASPSTPPSSVIARAEIVDALPNPLPPITEIGLSTGTGSSAGVHTTVNLPPQMLELSFDATFMTSQGTLRVMLGDNLLKEVTASQLGVRQSIRIPINLRLKRGLTTLPGAQELKFQLTGTPGTVVQLGKIRIPGAGLRWNPREKNSRWHFDTQGRGWGSVVDATRFRVDIKVISQEPRESSTAVHAASVAVLSTKSFDATKDIERDTLHFAGMPVRSKRDAKGNEHPQCAERDVNGDGRPDLVCEFEAPATMAGSTQKGSRRLEGMTPYGWSVEGRAE
jgi:hypothetical protein